MMTGAGYRRPLMGILAAKTTLILVLMVLPTVFLVGLDRDNAYGQDGADLDSTALQATHTSTTGGTVSAGDLALSTSHQGRFTEYAGSSTCLPCHQNEVYQVFDSVHYQWGGQATHVQDMETGGKLGGINDFCIYPDINFIGQMTNLDGQVIDGGCAGCHVGMGKKPETVATPEQLANIDCLGLSFG